MFFETLHLTSAKYVGDLYKLLKNKINEKKIAGSAAPLKSKCHRKI